MQQQQQSELDYVTVWNPYDIFRSEHRNYAVLVLNQPLLWRPQQMLPIWQEGKYIGIVIESLHVSSLFSFLSVRYFPSKILFFWK